MADVNCTRCPCGAAIEVSGGRGRPRKYCLECSPAKAGRSTARPSGGAQRQFDAECRQCSAAISSYAGRLYCSQKCNDLAKRERNGRACDVCGKPTWTLVGETARHKACVPIIHGTEATYRYHRCRCVKCRQVKRTAAAEYRAQRRAKGRPIVNAGWSGPWINPGLRRSIFERDNWICQLCSEPVDANAAPNTNWYPSLDHITPQSKGGTHTADNLRTAHRWCNSIRGANEYHSDLFYQVTSGEGR